MVAVTTSVLMLVAGSAAGLYYYEEKKNPPEQIVDQPVKEEETDSLVAEDVPVEEVVEKPAADPRTTYPEKKAETSVVKEQKVEETVRKTESQVSKPTASEQIAVAGNADKKVEGKQPADVNLHTDKPDVAVPSPSEEQIASFYNRLLASGKEKMNAKDYSGAKNDFTLAKDQMITEEVMRLLIACDEKIEEQRVADKKAQYEEKMPFGRYTIVRKKSNNRYGAIDNNGNERIPCKYLSVGKADKGRAFEREDNLYDIYASDGSVITQGATYY